jgi:hypothetical protein
MGRLGLMFGAALGPGYMAVSCDGCDEDSLGGIGGEAHIGWMLTPRLALLGDFWGTWHFTGEFTMEHIINTFAVQFWLGRIFWIKGGLGLGVVRFHYDDFLTVESELGFSVLGAGGVELISAPRFALDVQARLGATGFDGGSVGSFGLFLGLNWY